MCACDKTAILDAIFELAGENGKSTIRKKVGKGATDEIHLFRFYGKLCIVKRLKNDIHKVYRHPDLHRDCGEY